MSDCNTIPFLADAIEPGCAEASLRTLGPAYADLKLQAIRVVRCKPGRRCLVEYDATWSGSTGTLVGKIRAKGADHTTLELMRVLWAAGLDANSADGVSVPEPLGAVPALGMWVQMKVAGTPATRLLNGVNGSLIAERIANALQKLHRVTQPMPRRHGLADELAILDRLLGELAKQRPTWVNRLTRLMAGCHQLASDLDTPQRCGIHRDFYPDQVMVDGERIYLLDFDLYCLGDPALDAGNFVGHLIEQALRERGDPDAFANTQHAFVNRFAQPHERRRVHGYAVLTLARHVGMSPRFPERQASTDALLDHCEHNLNRWVR